MVKANELKRGRLVSHEGQYYTVHAVQIVAKGNWRSYVQVKLKHLKNGNVIDVRFGVDDRVETPFIDTRPFEFLYKDGNDYVLMDKESYDQMHVSADVLPDADNYLRGNETIVCGIIDGVVVTTEMPNSVELKVTDTPPAIKGATVTNQSKDAVVETGYRLRVPPFIENGEVIRIDTRTGEYLERAKG